MPQTTVFEFRALFERPDGPFAFSGFPYLITRICAGFHHMILLPRLAREALVDWGVRQHAANQLPMFVVMDWNDSVFINGDGATDTSLIPYAACTLTGRIETFPIPRNHSELKRRKAALAALLEGGAAYPPDISGYVVADRLDILREASGKELVALRGRGRGRVPKGLVRCKACRRHRGECLDTCAGYEGLVARVTCLCENNTRCVTCGEPFGPDRLNSGMWDGAENTLWHVPAFGALSHRCSGRGA